MRADDTPLSAGSIAVVTGATGFIGSALVESLVRQGIEVRCLTRRPPRASEANTRGVEWHVVDWADQRSLDRSPALDGVRFVFHLAGLTKARSLEAFRAGNVRPARALLASLAHRGESIERFLLVSSQAAAGPATSLDAPRRESDAPAPIDAYGVSKLEAERVLEGSDPRIPWTIVRPSSVYGPGDRDFLAVFKQVRSGLWLYPATRDRWLSLAYVDDIVRGIVAAATSARSVSRTYYLAGEPPLVWREVYRAAAAASRARRLLELDLPQLVVNVAGHAGDALSLLTRRVGLVNSQKVALGRAEYWVCSAARAFEELELGASTPLAVGMARTYAWYRRAGWL